jgi:ureidoglycolate lyase
MGGRTVKVKVLKANPETFARFGALIKLPEEKPSVDVSGVLIYWDQVVNLNVSGGEAELGFLVTRFRPFVFTSMERHTRSDETFIPLEGKACLFALAPAKDSSDPHELPDPDEVVAFILDGSFGVNLNAGVWHWAPFPLADSMQFVLALRKGTVEEDIDLRDLGKELGVNFVLEIA